MNVIEKIEYLCVSENEFLNIIEKLRNNNLSEKDKDIIFKIMINHRDIMVGILNGTLKGKDLEKHLKKIGIKSGITEKTNSIQKNEKSDESIKEVSPKKDDAQEEIENKNSSEETIGENKDAENTTGKIKKKNKHPKKKQKTKKMGKRGHKKFSNAGEKKHIFDPLFIKQSFCPCCGESEKLYSLIPSVTVLFSGVPPVLPESHITEKARCSSCGVTISAQVPAEVENSVGRFLPSAVAQFAMTRFSLGFPHHRMEILNDLYGLHIPDSNQWSTIETVALEMESLLTCLTRNAANAKWIGIDDASARVVELKKEIKIELSKAKNPDTVRTGIQSTVFVAKTYSDHNIVLYMTGRNHQGENKSFLLELRTNNNSVIIMSDAANKALMKIKTLNNVAIIETNCLEHLRIKLEEIKKNYPLETTYILNEISKVYKNDAHCKKECFNDLQRLVYHQSYSAQIMSGIKFYLEKELRENPRAEPNGDYAKKVLFYALKHWERLTGFLTHAGAEIDNNPTERKTKPVVRHRQSSKKYLTEHGASIGDFYMTLIETCKLNNVQPLEYLEFCITHRSLIEDDPELFLPWNYLETKKEIEEELQNRSRYRIVSQRGAYIQKAEPLHSQQ